MIIKTLMTDVEEMAWIKDRHHAWSSGNIPIQNLWDIFQAVLSDQDKKSYFI